MSDSYIQDMNFWQLVRNRQLAPLLRLRWSGQFIDGLFQSALASFVLFSPERQASAMAAATAFAVVLLPYSFIGPFVGTILDRFSRQRAIALANATRSLTLIFIALLVFRGETGVTLTILVLIAFGVNRLILAGLSAGLPLLAPKNSLIAANALVNAAGPWVADALENKIHSNTQAKIRLVQGSHIVVKKLFDHDRAYIFSNYRIDSFIQLRTCYSGYCAISFSNM